MEILKKKANYYRKTKQQDVDQIETHYNMYIKFCICLQFHYILIKIKTKSPFRSP